MLIIFIDMISLKELLIESKEEWKEPTIEAEESDFEMLADQLDISLDKIKEAFDEGELKRLMPSVWDKLKNCDCKKANSFKDIVDLSQKLQKKNPDYKSNWKQFKKDFKNNKPVKAPIVMKYGDDYYLVAGNTRLMVAKLMDVSPAIYLFVY